MEAGAAEPNAQHTQLTWAFTTWLVALDVHIITSRQAIVVISFTVHAAHGFINCRANACWMA